MVTSSPSFRRIERCSCPQGRVRVLQLYFHWRLKDPTYLHVGIHKNTHPKIGLPGLDLKIVQSLALKGFESSSAGKMPPGSNY